MAAGRIAPTPKASALIGSQPSPAIWCENPVKVYRSVRGAGSATDAASMAGGTTNSQWRFDPVQTGSAMATETKLRETIAGSFNKARTKIRSYAGLYASDALVGDVLAACDEVLQWIDIKEDFKEARRAVQMACQQLATAATERRSHEGGAIISKRRDETLEAIDQFQAGLFSRGTASMK